MQVKVWLVAILIVSAPVAEAGAETDSVSVEIPDTTWPKIYLPSFDGVTQALGMKPLRKVGVRRHAEVRIWIGGGIYAPEQAWFLRRSSSGWDGELVLYWSAPERKMGRAARELRRQVRAWCDDPRTGRSKIACFDELPGFVDWSGIVSRLESLGLWELPDASALPTPAFVMADGWSMTVELHSGTTYRAYHFNNPDQAPRPEAAKAAEIARCLPGVVFLVGASDESEP